jgi:hypothetical protein
MAERKLSVDDNSVAHTADAVMSILQKAFLFVSAGNISLSVLAFFEFIPVVAPAVSMLFVIWIGVLTARGKMKDNKLKDIQIEKEQQERQVDEANG